MLCEGCVSGEMAARAEPSEGTPVENELSAVVLDKLEEQVQVEMNSIEGGRVAVPVTTEVLGVDLKMVTEAQVRSSVGHWRV